MLQSRRHQPFSNPPVKVALIAVFTALSLGTNYAMIDIPNVKLMDALIFIAAFLFGLEVGLGSAVFVWIIYGFINPYGQAGFTLLLFLIAGECFYAIAGALLSRSSVARDLLAKRIQSKPVPRQRLTYSIDPKERSFLRVKARVRKLLNKARQYGPISFFFGVIGFQTTFAYDVLTNFGSWVFTTSSIYQALVIGIITGVPFAILHEASNIVFFATVVPLAIATSKRAGLAVQDTVA